MRSFSKVRAAAAPGLKPALAAMMTVVILAASACSHTGSPKDSPTNHQPTAHRALKTSRPTLSTVQETVSRRGAPEITRVPYPVSPPGDPAQNWGDLHLPAGSHRKQSVPLVVLIHGGGWQAAVGAQALNSYAEDLTTRGVAVYNIEYRRVGTGGGWPVTFTDVAAAMDHVPQIMAANPELSGSMALAGHSAGAQLALWAGSRGGRPPFPCRTAPKIRPARVISLAGPLDMRAAAGAGDAGLISVMGGLPQSFAKRYQAVDPILNPPASVPVLAVHGDRDRTVPMELSQKYMRELKAMGGLGKLEILEHEDHGSFIRPQSPVYDHVLNEIADF